MPVPIWLTLVNLLPPDIHLIDGMAAKAAVGVPTETGCTRPKSDDIACQNSDIEKRSLVTIAPTAA